MVSGLNPLAWLVALSGDARLSHGEMRVLQRAIVHTDNKTGKVHQSLTNLAAEAGVSDKTASRAVKAGEELDFFVNVARYHTGKRNTVDIWFRFYPPTTGQQDGTAQSTGHHDGAPSSSTEEQSTGQGTGQSTGHHDAASTPSTPSTTSTTSTFTFLKVSDLTIPFVPDDLTHEEAAAEKSHGHRAPCGCFTGATCPECRGDAPRHSKHSPQKQRQLYEQQVEHDEGLGTDGTPLDREKSAAGYRSRQRS